MPASEKTLSSLVKSFRVSVGMKQEEFAKRLGKSTSTLQRYENKEDPQPQDLAKLALLAEEENQLDVAGVFARAAIAELPEDIVSLIRHLYARELGRSAGPTEKSLLSGQDSVSLREGEVELLEWWRSAGDGARDLVQVWIKHAKERRNPGKRNKGAATD